MIKKITTLTSGILFLISTAGYAAGPGKGPNDTVSGKVSQQVRSQFQRQIQVDKNCDGPQIKTQKRTRTNYSK